MGPFFTGLCIGGVVLWIIALAKIKNDHGWED